MESNTEKNLFLNGTLLMADASGENISACLAKDSKVIAEKFVRGGALENFFATLKELFGEAEISPKEIGAFGFCEGPGSVLGIRIVSAAMATLRASNPQSTLFTWKLLDCYAELLRPKMGDTFSVVCPSRKNYANALSVQGGKTIQEEILSEGISELPQPRLLINQRYVADPNFAGLCEIFFSAVQIFELLKSNSNLACKASAHETPDALMLAKREYVKWNSKPHS